MSLTDEQAAVANHPGGHALVSAVAGSGKTTAMIARICTLLDQGEDPERILVLLFNKSARDDFHARLKAKLGNKSAPEVFTYHAFGLRLCEALEEAGKLNLATLDSSGKRIQGLARQVLAQQNAQLPTNEQFDLGMEEVKEFLEIVDVLKNGLYQGGSTLPEGVKKLPEKYLNAYRALEEARKSTGLRSFTDLVYDPISLANTDGQVARYLANRYEHIIVDEFQDANEAQISMIQYVAGTRALVMAVGDEDQTIYRWRGARPDYMTHRFTDIFPGTTRYSLSKTHRYGQTLSDLANNVIQHNQNRAAKKCVSARPIQTDVVLQMHQDSAGKNVCAELMRWTKQGNSLNDAAILVREYNNTIPVEIALQANRIPYRLEGAPSFVDRPESMAIRAYLQLCLPEGLAGVSTHDQRKTMITSLLSYPSLYLRRDEIEQIVSAIQYNPVAFIPTAERHLKQLISGSNAFSIDRRMRSVSAWKDCAAHDPHISAARFLLGVYKQLDLFQAIRKQNSRKEVADEKIRLLHNMIRLAEAGRHTVASFARYLNTIAETIRNTDKSAGAVLLTSVHRAKGMEWPLVIMPDLAEGSFPKKEDDEGNTDVEDERRLFYVAMTRAMKRLTLIAPFDPMLVAAAMNRQFTVPDLNSIKASRFLYEGQITP